MDVSELTQDQRIIKATLKAKSPLSEAVGEGVWVTLSDLDVLEADAASSRCVYTERSREVLKKFANMLGAQNLKIDIRYNGDFEGTA